jgi:iron complex outermembrane receptor protein
LDLPLRDTPASVDVIPQQTMQDQGYRTNVEVAQGAVGVIAINPGGAQGGFSMRGFSGDALNHLYNGISIGIQDLTGRTQDTFSFDRVEFLKGASAIESGVGSIGGSVNYMTKQPFSGPVQNETFVSVDSFRGVRSGFDSGGSTPIAGLDYRVTASFDNLRGFTDDTRKAVSTLTGRLNYQNSDVLRTWIAFEYYNDQGNQYWGTPITPVSFSGPFSTPGVVSGVPRGSLSPVTVDSRTLTTNYNTLDNHDSAKQFWGRTGFDLEIAPGLLLKEQAYLYKAQRTFFDDEFFIFDSAPANKCTPPSPTCVVDRFPFYVSHNQHLIGNVTNLTWDSSFFGMPNRFAAEIAASRNFLRFTQQTNTSTSNTVSLVNPARGFFGPLVTQEFTTQLDSVSESFEERLKVTPTIALIGGVRIDELKITNNGFDPSGTQLSAFPVSKTWEPVSYRAAATWEPIEKLVFYGLYGTSYDPASAPIQLAGFQAARGFPLTLTSSRIEEVGVKQSLWNNRAEWTFAAFDLDRRNVIQVVSTHPTVFGVAGDIESKGIELGGAIRPVDGLKLWGNIAYTHARFGSDILLNPDTNLLETVHGNAPANVAPIIVNAGASYRFEPRIWPTPWPVEIGASVRHVGNRYITTANDVIMDAYTVADAYMFIDFEKPSWLPSVDKTRLSFRVRNLTNKTYADFVDPGTSSQVYLGAPRSYEAALSFKFGPTAQAVNLDAGYRKAAPLLFDWRGFYLGGNLGGAFSEEKIPMPLGTPLGTWSPNPGGVLGGIQLGYNFIAAPNWLIGIEGEFDWTSAQGTVVIPNGPTLPAATVTSNHNWYDTVEGRFGFFQGPSLYYVKGGAAWLGADYRLTDGVTMQSVTNTRPGWTVGAGIEYMWAPNWSVKAEYDFLDFGTRNVGFDALGTTIGVNTHVNEFKVGFNYRWLPGTLFGGL